MYISCIYEHGHLKNICFQQTESKTLTVHAYIPYSGLILAGCKFSPIFTHGTKLPI